MDFSIERLEGEKIRYFESGPESPLQVVFLPGIFNPEIWRHQLRYFRGNFRTISYSTDAKDYLTQKRIAEKILEKRDLENAVIVSQGLGNSISQELEYRENVIATVMTGAIRNPRLYPQRLYNPAVKLLKSEPKLFKKAFFSSVSDYRVVRQFLKDVELPSHRIYSSFVNEHALRRPVKKSMIIHPMSDRFSSVDEARRLHPEACISVIQDAGTFSFYEKPEEYNKALLDFLNTLEGFVETREVSQTQQENRSLKDFVEITE